MGVQPLRTPYLQAHVQGEVTSDGPSILRLVLLCWLLIPTRIPDGNPDVSEEEDEEKNEFSIEDQGGADEEWTRPMRFLDPVASPSM